MFIGRVRGEALFGWLARWLGRFGVTGRQPGRRPNGGWWPFGAQGGRWATQLDAIHLKDSLKLYIDSACADNANRSQRSGAAAGHRAPSPPVRQQELHLIYDP